MKNKILLGIIGLSITMLVGCTSSSDDGDSIVGTWKLECVLKSDGRHMTRTLVFNADGTAHDTRVYYETDACVNIIEDYTKVRDCTYVVGGETLDFNNDKAYELDRTSSDGRMYYTMFKFKSNGNLLKAGDQPLHDGHDEASRANYFDPGWPGFEKQ